MQPEIPKQGALAPGELPVVLRALVRHLVDGRLDVHTGDATRTIWLEAGQIRAMVSDVEDEKLGRWLVGRGFLQPHQMALALLRQPDAVLYGKQLITEGALDVLQLQGELEARAVSLLSRLLFVEGSYNFRLGEKFGGDSLTFEKTTASLLAAAVRAYEDVARLEGFVDGGRYLWAGQDALMLYQKLDLTPHEAYLFSRIDGTTSAARLRRLVPLPAEEVTRAVAALVVAGLVELRDDPAVRPMAPPEIELPQATEAEEEEQLQFTPEQRREYEEVIKLAAENRHRDYYKRLNLTPGATQDQVHSRFRELTRLYHPDRAREPHLHSLRRELAEIYAAVQDAYETLVSPEKRGKYDQLMKGSDRTSTENMKAEERRLSARKQVVDANVKRAQELARVGDVGMAVQLLDQAVRFDPQSELLLQLAHLEFKNPMWVQRALDHLKLAVSVDPKCTEAWLQLANFWGVRGKKDRQRQCLERVLEYDPTNDDVIRALDEFNAKKKKR